MFVGFNLKVDSENQILNFEEYIENNQFSCKNMEFVELSLIRRDILLIN